MPLAMQSGSRLFGWTPPVAPDSYETSFPATENPISEGGIWQNGGVGGTMPFSNVQTVSGLAMADDYIYGGEDYEDSSAIIDPAFIDFGPDQYAEITLYIADGYTPTSSHEVIVALRGTVNVNGPAYFPHYHFLFTQGGGFQIFWLDGTFGDFTELSPTAHSGGFPPFASGDVLRCEFQGTTYRVKYNGSLRYSGTSAHIATGQPGAMFYVVDNPGQDLSKFCISHFKCGSL